MKRFIGLILAATLAVLLPSHTIHAQAGVGLMLSSHGFSPGLLSPTAWYRSDLGITTASTLVTAWADQSGHGYTLTPAVAGPVYTSSGGAGGQAYLSYPGGTVLGLQNTSFTMAPYPAEWFVVGQSTTTAPPVSSAVLVDLGFQNDFTAQTSGEDLETYNGNIIISAIGSALLSPFVLDVCNLGSASTFFTFNNGSVMMPGDIGTNAQGTSVITVGNYQGETTGNSWIGTIYEVVVFDHQLSSGQRALMQSYIAARYGGI